MKRQYIYSAIHFIRSSSLPHSAKMHWSNKTASIDRLDLFTRLTAGTCAKLTLHEICHFLPVALLNATSALLLAIINLVPAACQLLVQRHLLRPQRPPANLNICEAETEPKYGVIVAFPTTSILWLLLNKARTCDQETSTRMRSLEIALFSATSPGNEKAPCSFSFVWITLQNSVAPWYYLSAKTAQLVGYSSRKGPLSSMVAPYPSFSRSAGLWNHCISLKITKSETEPGSCVVQ